MRKSSTPDYEEMIDDYGFNDFDPRLDFSKFLEEAKHHATEDDFKAPSALSCQQQEEETGKKGLEGEKKSKKSWKNTLFSWLKSNKKNKPLMKPERITHLTNSRRVHVSGPIYGGAKAVDSKPRWRPTSGPIASLFNPTMRMETEIPYVCLDQLTRPNPNPNHSYGPVYLVT